MEPPDADAIPRRTRRFLENNRSRRLFNETMRAFDSEVQHKFAHFGPNVTLCVIELKIEGKRKMSLLLIIVVLLLLFGSGGGYYAHRNYGGAALGRGPD